jgi:uncharacterized protein
VTRRLIDGTQTAEAQQALAAAPAAKAAANVPIDTYIVKVASRCNLNCSYCYVYNKGDESFRSQPYRMRPATVSALLSRVANHCLEEKLEHVTFIFHGGEPLLAGSDFFRQFVTEAETILKGHATLSYALETNGTLLTSDWLELFRELNVSFGISLDGPEEIHDRNRVNHSGAGSYSRVRRALDLVRADRRLDPLFGGVLTVIDLAAEPLILYRHLKEIGIRRCDFLLPDGTYDNPPPMLSLDGLDTPYADWLIAIFDEWFRNQDTMLSIRIFENIINLLFDPGGGNETMGGGQNGVLVIETDGGMEPVDALKICGPSFTKLGLNVERNEIRDVYSSELVQLYHHGAAGLCATCRTCPVVAVCGGGYLPHRYSSPSGFANPSIYCRDLIKLITHVRSSVLATIPEELRQELGMEPVSYEEIISAVPRQNGMRPKNQT